MGTRGGLPRFEFDVLRMQLEEVILRVTYECFTISLIEQDPVELIEHLEAQPWFELHKNLGICRDAMKEFVYFLANECFIHTTQERWDDSKDLRNELRDEFPSVAFFDEATLQLASDQILTMFTFQFETVEKHFERAFLEFAAHGLCIALRDPPPQKAVVKLLRDMHRFDSSADQARLLMDITECLSSGACPPEFAKLLHFLKTPPSKCIHHKVAQFGSLDVLKSMVRSGEFRFNVVSDYKALTPLHFALEARREKELLSMLLEYEARVDAQDADGNEPLHLASQLGMRHAAEQLLGYGADGFARNGKGQTPLDLAPDDRFRKVLRKAIVEAALLDKRETLQSSLERMSWVAILLTTATFVAFMAPPRGTTADEGLVKQLDHDLAPLMTSFWLLDILAFFLSLVTVVQVVARSLPSQGQLTVMGVWRALAAVSATLIAAATCGFGAMAVGILLVFSVRPPAYVALGLGAVLLLLAVTLFGQTIGYLYPGELGLRQVLFNAAAGGRLGRVLQALKRAKEVFRQELRDPQRA
ncbi:hypothetical protein PLESTF_000923100 [Pleodorina starrii]|nr:hypothetical protein PLESTM_000989500 [Pleodorina starrii]GLC70091.1 hypothetical protein PLESTF_000923100 [Pleodorina starrii]